MEGLLSLGPLCGEADTDDFERAECDDTKGRPREEEGEEERVDFLCVGVWTRVRRVAWSCWCGVGQATEVGNEHVSHGASEEAHPCDVSVCGGKQSWDGEQPPWLGEL